MSPKNIWRFEKNYDFYPKNLNTKSSSQRRQKIFGDLKEITPVIPEPQKIEHQIIITVSPKSIWKFERDYPFYPKNLNSKSSPQCRQKILGDLKDEKPFIKNLKKSSLQCRQKIFGDLKKITTFIQKT